MSTPVTINTTAIQYQSNTTECHCVIVADSIVGATTVQQMVVLDSADLTDDWTDAELCEAVATKLGVPVEDVSVAVRPEPVVVDVPEADFGNPPQGDTPQPLTPEDVSPAVAPV